ncbi:hypothetical protein GLYMA_03G207800v4, partial [Glycine max]
FIQIPNLKPLNPSLIVFGPGTPPSSSSIVFGTVLPQFFLLLFLFFFVKCRFVVVGRSFFSSSLGKPGTLGSGTEYWRGYYQSLRPTQMGLSLNINVSARAFYEPIPAIDFIESHFRVNPSRPNQAMVYDSIAAVLIPSAANTRNPRKKKRV